MSKCEHLYRYIEPVSRNECSGFVDNISLDIECLSKFCWNGNNYWYCDLRSIACNFHKTAVAAWGCAFWNRDFSKQLFTQNGCGNPVPSNEFVEVYFPSTDSTVKTSIWIPYPKHITSRSYSSVEPLDVCVGVCIVYHYPSSIFIYAVEHRVKVYVSPCASIILFYWTSIGIFWRELHSHISKFCSSGISKLKNAPGYGIDRSSKDIKSNISSLVA